MLGFPQGRYLFNASAMNINHGLPPFAKLKWLRSVSTNIRIYETRVDNLKSLFSEHGKSFFGLYLDIVSQETHSLASIDFSTISQPIISFDSQNLQFFYSLPKMSWNGRYDVHLLKLLHFLAIISLNNLKHLIITLFAFYAI